VAYAFPWYEALTLFFGFIKLQHTKMCNQIAIATNMIGVVESMIYGFKAGWPTFPFCR